VALAGRLSAADVLLAALSRAPLPAALLPPFSHGKAPKAQVQRLAMAMVALKTGGPLPVKQLAGMHDCHEEETIKYIFFNYWIARSI
jgi:hypothetical protein